MESKFILFIENRMVNKYKIGKIKIMWNFRLSKNQIWKVPNRDFLILFYQKQAELHAWGLNKFYEVFSVLKKNKIKKILFSFCHFEKKKKNAE